MKTLAMFLPIAAMRKKADQFAVYCFGRWDVPQGPDVPADLQDKEGGFMDSTPDGIPHSNILLPCDVQDISIMNPVSIVLSGLLPIFAAVSVLPAVLGFWPTLKLMFLAGGALLALATVIMLWLNQVGLFRVIAIAILGYLIPMSSAIPGFSVF